MQKVNTMRYTTKLSLNNFTSTPLHRKPSFPHYTVLYLFAGSLHDSPAPAKENQPTPVRVTSKERNNMLDILDYFCQHATQNGPPLPLSPELFDHIVPESIDKTTRAAVWCAGNELLEKLRQFQLAQSGGNNEDQAICTSSDTALTHYDLVHRDVIAIMSTVNGGIAVRGQLIPKFAKHLQEADSNEDIYNMFLDTHAELKSEVPDQILEFRCTLTKKMCLKNIMNPPERSRSPSAVSLFSCVGQQTNPSRAPRNPFGRFRSTM